MTALTEKQFKEVTTFARQMRRDILKMVTDAKSGHPGGSLSITDLLALLYNVEMNIDPMDSHRPDRDRLVLSKGHAAPGLPEEVFLPKKSFGICAKLMPCCKAIRT